MRDKRIFNNNISNGQPFKPSKIILIQITNVTTRILADTEALDHLK